MVGSAELHIGNIDSIDYKQTITEDKFREAYARLEKEQIFGHGISAHYALRGGKERGKPQEHAYQMNYCLGLDCYAQYLVVTHFLFPYSDDETLTSTYNISERFNGGARGQYGEVKNNIMPLLHHPSVNVLPELKAINLLYYCIAAQENADVSGPFSYLEDKKNSENPTTFNDLPTIYKGIEANIDTIVNCLKHFKEQPDWYQQKMLADVLSKYRSARCALKYKNDDIVESYWRLANSLKLRMAMHIVKVEPALAQKWAEEAVESGVIESELMSHGFFPHLDGFANPLGVIVNGWNDNRISASFESLLMSLNHPYINMVFDKNSKKIGKLEANSKVLGIRSGTFVKAGQDVASNEYIAYSGLNNNVIGTAPLYIMKWSEVDFLRAEGALRGWKMGGDAKFFYERGIKNAALDEPDTRPYYKYMNLKAYDEQVEKYMSQEKPVDYKQYDPLADNEIDSPTKIGVKWNDGDDRETKLEKIITQKYIALFPLSIEAWTDLRRTGYPKLIPVLNADDGDGSIKQGDVIRRVPWYALDPQTQDIVDKSGKAALGGDDLQGQRLWWDVEGPNFK